MEFRFAQTTEATLQVSTQHTELKLGIPIEAPRNKSPTLFQGHTAIVIPVYF